MTTLLQSPTSSSESVVDAANPKFVDALVFLCAPAAAAANAFGYISILGQVIYPAKVIIPVLFLASFGRSLDVLRMRGSYAQLLLVLVGWSIATLAWAADPGAGVREVSMLVFGVLAASALAAACCRPSGVRAMLRGWVAAGIMTATVAAWEFLTGNHLPSEYVIGNTSSLARTLLSTFGNPNDFGAFIVLSIPFIGLVATKAGAGWGLGTRDRLVAQGLLLLLPAFLVLSGSRFAIIGLALSSACYVILNRHWRSAWRFASGIAALGAVVVVVALISGLEFVAKFETLLDDEPFTVGSDETRVNLLLNGFDFVWRTRGVGIGAGGYEPAILSGNYRFPVGGDIVNPHSFPIEVLSQYGIFGFGILVVVFFAAAKAFFRFRRSNVTLSVQRAASICLAGFAGYFIATFAASSYISSPVNWMFIASYLAMVPALSNLQRRSVPTSTVPDANDTPEFAMETI